MNCYDFIKILRGGTYGDLERFKKFLEASFQKFPTFCMSAVISHVIASERIDSLEYILTEFNRTTTHKDITDAVSQTFGIAVLEIVCDHAPKKELNLALIALSSRSPPRYVKVLLDKGADPTSNNGRAMLAAVEDGRFETLKLLYSHGGELTASLFDAACYWEYYPIAYWLHERGAKGYETPGFLAYKAKKDAVRDLALRRFQLKCMRKLMEKKEFILKQGERSWEELFGKKA
jgi:hypothetical protein